MRINNQVGVSILNEFYAHNLLDRDAFIEIANTYDSCLEPYYAPTDAGAAEIAL